MKLFDYFDLLVKSLKERLKLFDGKEARGPTSKVDEPYRTPAHDGLLGDEFNFASQGRNVAFYFFGIHLGEHLEVTKLAPLPAERDVQIKTKWSLQRGAVSLELFLWRVRHRVLNVG